MSSSWNDRQLFSSTDDEHGTEEWATPWALYNALDEEFHFELDAAAADANHKCDRYLTKEMDAFTQCWAAIADSIFLNPPYGKTIGEWLRKAYYESREGAVVVALVMARTDCAWWWTWALRAGELRFIRGRVHFISDDGRNNSAPASSALLIFDTSIEREDSRYPNVRWVELPRIDK